jgi:hypothetical protein
VPKRKQEKVQLTDQDDTLSPLRVGLPPIKEVMGRNTDMGLACVCVILVDLWAPFR